MAATAVVNGSSPRENIRLATECVLVHLPAASKVKEQLQSRRGMSQSVLGAVEACAGSVVVVQAGRNTVEAFTPCGSLADRQATSFSDWLEPATPANQLIGPAYTVICQLAAVTYPVSPWQQMAVKYAAWHGLFGSGMFEVDAAQLQLPPGLPASSIPDGRVLSLRTCEGITIIALDLAALQQQAGGHEGLCTVEAGLVLEPQQEAMALECAVLLKNTYPSSDRFRVLKTAVAFTIVGLEFEQMEQKDICLLGRFTVEAPRLEQCLRRTLPFVYNTPQAPNFEVLLEGDPFLSCARLEGYLYVSLDMDAVQLWAGRQLTVCSQPDHSPAANLHLPEICAIPKECAGTSLQQGLLVAVASAYASAKPWVSSLLMAVVGQPQAVTDIRNVNGEPTVVFDLDYFLLMSHKAAGPLSWAAFMMASCLSTSNAGRSS